MIQYGDWFLSNDPLPESESKPLLMKQYDAVMLVLFRAMTGSPKDGKLEFFLNVPYEAYDEETNEVVRGFTHGWKWTSRL